MIAAYVFLVGAENLRHLGRCSADHSWIGPAFGCRAGRSRFVRRWDDLRLVGLKLIFLIVSRAAAPRQPQPASWQCAARAASRWPARAGRRPVEVVEQHLCVVPAAGSPPAAARPDPPPQQHPRSDFLIGVQQVQVALDGLPQLVLGIPAAATVRPPPVVVPLAGVHRA